MTPSERYQRLFERRNRREHRSRALVAAALAVVGHLGLAALLAFLSLMGFGGPTPRRGPDRPVVLRPLAATQWAKNRGPNAPDNRSRESVAERSPAPAPPAQPPKKPEPMPKGQVVDVAPGNGEQDPNAKYLAESSNRVKKETRAKEQTPFYRNAMPHPTSPTPNPTHGADSADKVQIAGNGGRGADERPAKDTQRKSALEIPDVKRHQELAMRMNKDVQGPGAKLSNQAESPEVKGNSDRLRLERADPGGQAESASPGKTGLPGIKSLLPSSAFMDKIAGAAPNDHLSDTDEGEGTYLNTKEWKYASFFNRVKQSVGMHWDPLTPLRQRDPTFNIYGGHDRYTVLNITLTERGMVKEIYVEKSCGLDFLDSEAVKSFERAQPFPNPPPGLTGADGVHFSFGFFLDMGRGAGLRLFRSGG